MLDPEVVYFANIFTVAGGDCRREVLQLCRSGRISLADMVLDQAGMVSGLTSKRQKVIAAAADEDQSLRTSMAKDLFIACGDWQPVP